MNVARIKEILLIIKSCNRVQIIKNSANPVVREVEPSIVHPVVR